MIAVATNINITVLPVVTGIMLRVASLFIGRRRHQGQDPQLHPGRDQPVAQADQEVQLPLPGCAEWQLHRGGLHDRGGQQKARRGRTGHQEGAHDDRCGRGQEALRHPGGAHLAFGRLPH